MGKTYTDFSQLSKEEGGRGQGRRGSDPNGGVRVVGPCEEGTFGR